MLKRLREYLTLILIGTLPFHAFFVTVGTRLISGPGHAPLIQLVLWKEILLGIILLIAFIEWIRTPSQFSRSRWLFDDIDLLILGLIALSIIMLIVQSSNAIHAQSYIYGFKYDFIPLIALFILRRVVWSKIFFKEAIIILITVGAVIAVYAIITLYLPEQFFYWLGYNNLHSLYFPNQPLSAFQYLEGGGWRRVQSVMSGSNQLGLWLLIPWSIGLVAILSKSEARRSKVTSRWLLVTSLIGVAIFLTFSRSAWIGAVVIVIVAVILTQSKTLVKRYIVNMLAAGVIALIVGIIAKPDVFLRLSSSREHLVRPMKAVMTIWNNPFGLGLGTAGPASNRVSDTCVNLKANDDPSWAMDKPDLCVFLGDSQIQPTDRICNCPNLPENWYLQIGVELGLIGLTVFTLLVLFIMRLLKKRKEVLSVFLAFLGISIAGLFLHVWEDSAVAYTMWILVSYSFSLSSFFVSESSIKSN